MQVFHKFSLLFWQFTAGISIFLQRFYVILLPIIMTQTTQIPENLQEILADFNECEGSEKLEYLLEFAESLPELPAWLSEKRDSMEPIHECMTPVFVYGRPNDAGKMVYYFDAPPESPTVRGFAGIMVQGVNDTSTPAQVLDIPDNFYLQSGLQRVLTGQRMHGMSTFLRYMKKIAAEYV